MAEVTLTIGGRHHQVLCRDGEEAQVERLGRMLEERWADADRAAGGLSAERAMMFVALMLADDLDEARRNPAAAADAAPALPPGLADRLEAIAAALEQSASGS
ncbi:cell division protein ZapA [Hephaestia mangrovi]|jgi:cell division protein ZapA|uniref:cell division protein ZapA n=1 Tax=Hephaestia mangrovi TaxID=2873268 RepID=UPI001CA76BEA|nr:cell division protein ZapA [Hephaestia mangrovi]MBY8828574.1 cell division protein ZapA [Hephaestia mangrovi]